MSVHIREAEDRDAAALAALANLVGERVHGGAGAMTEEIVLRDVLTPATELRALVAEVEGEVAGMALHLFAYETAFAARGRYLQDIAVFPGARRRGVARALIAALARLTRDEGGEFLWWMNMDTMPEGRALYRKICDEEAAVRSFAVTRGRFQALADEG
ncbi:MAG: GNAT family N-acetyltransferase [Pseudomonadota bacterium]